MGVVDVAGRQDRVQNRLHRRGRRVTARAGQAQLVGHLRVAELVEPGQRQQVIETDGCEAPFGDGREIAAGPLDVEDVEGPAEEVGLGQLDGGVAAAVHDERRLGAEEP